jgi:hypothetical protein
MAKGSSNLIVSKQDFLDRVIQLEEKMQRLYDVIQRYEDAKKNLDQFIESGDTNYEDMIESINANISAGYNSGIVAGVVARAEKLTLTNVKFDGCISAPARREVVGGIIGQIDANADAGLADTKLTQVGVSKNSVIFALDAEYLGGIIGNVYTNSTQTYAEVITMQYCYFEGTIYGAPGVDIDYSARDSLVGGLVGSMEKVSNPAQKLIISHSYVTGSIYACGIIGGLVGLLNNTVINNSY